MCIAEWYEMTLTLLSSQVAATAVELVWCVITSKPWPMSDFSVASASLPGSYQAEVHTTRTVALGLTDVAGAEREGVDALENLGDQRLAT